MQVTESKQVTPFMKIGAASRATGLSQYFLRQGCKDGSVPHIRSGTKIFIDYEHAIAKLREGETA